MEHAHTNPGSRGASDADPVELLRSFRWTQQLASRLVHDPATAEDVQQEAWVRAVERFGDTLPGRTWLAGTIRSLAFRAGRSRGRRRHHEGRGALPESVSSTAEVILRSEAQQRVAAAVARLPEAHRLTVLLHFQEGLSLAAVAKNLGCSKSAAGDRVQRGLTALRKDLRDTDANWTACCLIAVPFKGGGASLTMSTVAATSTTLTSLIVKKALVIAAALFVAAVAVSRLRSPDVVPASVAPRLTIAQMAETVQRPDSQLDAPPADVLANVGGTPGDRAAASTLARAAPSQELYLLRARVTDSNGSPVPSARMRAETYDWKLEAVGDAGGFVELQLNADEIEAAERKDIDIIVSGDQFQTQWARCIWRTGTGAIDRPKVGAVEDFGTVVLRPAGCVEGRAYGPSRRPVAGARIIFYEVDPARPELRSGYQGNLLDVETDHEGRFFVPHIGTQAIALGVAHSDFLRKSPLTKCEVTVGEVTGPVLVFGAAAEIVTGRVLDPAGQPVVGAYVNGTGNWSRTDTDQTDENGRFRIALRGGSPAAVEAHHLGWREIDPAKHAQQGEGEIEIRMERVLPDAEFRVLVVDGETGEPVVYAGLAVHAGETTSGEKGARLEGKPKLVVQPAEGIPVDLTPGQDQLFVTARGYQSRVVSTAKLEGAATTMTVELEPALGVRGFIVENGLPVPDVRVQLASIDVLVAKPREALRSGSVVRLPQERVDTEAITGRGGYSSVMVLGLDGDPPPYQVTPMSPDYGQRTDEAGRFHFERVEETYLGLEVLIDGQSPRFIGHYRVENGALDLGEVEIGIGAPASLAGQIESTWVWDPEEYVLTLEGPEREVPLDSDGGFRLDGLTPGSVYFTVERRGTESDERAFHDVPVFHVHLAAGENRSVTVSLDSYAPSSLDLHVTIGGKPPVGNCFLEVTPIDEPTRTVRLWCDVEGHAITAKANALGPCTLALTQSASHSGWVRLQAPGPPLELRAGEAATRTIDVPAGWAQLAIPAGHAATDFGHVDLILTDADQTFEVLGRRLAAVKEGEASQPQTIRAGPIPPGTYRASLQPSRWRHAGDAGTVLAEFEVTVTEGQVAEITLE